MSQPKPTSDPSESLRSSRWGSLAIAVLAVVVCLPTLYYGLVNYDDPWLFTDNLRLQQLAVAEVPSLFFDFSRSTRYMLGAEYLPIRDLSVALDFRLWGTWYQGFHLTQLLIHGLSVYGLARLLLRFGISQRIALLTAALWALHPLHIESICWLTERKGMMSAAFVIATGHAYIRYRRAGRGGWLVAACVLAVCAVWSKAPALFGIAGLGAFDLLLLRGANASAANNRWRALIAMGFCAALAFVPVFYTAQDAKVIVDEDKALAISASGVNNAATAPAPMLVGLIGHYVQSIVLTRSPSISYPIAHQGPAPSDYVIGAMTMVGSVAVFVVALRRRRYHLTAAAVAWSALCFFPASRLLFPIAIIAADRYMLLALIGPALLMASAAARIRHHKLFVGVAVAMITACTVMSLQTQRTWATSIALFANATEQNPDSAELWLRLSANVYLSTRDKARAEQVVDLGLALHPTDSSLILKKANYRAAQDDLSDAEMWLRRGCVLNYARAYQQLALLMISTSRSAEAVQWAQRAVDKRPNVGAFRKTLATALQANDQLPQAIVELRALVALGPVAESHFELGKALWVSNQRIEAQAEFELARAAPEFAAQIEQLIRARP
jgi:protein O-mannosyl-transferase